MAIQTSLAYLLAVVLLIVGLKLLSRPQTARRGNRLGALGMLVAVVATLADQRIIDFSLIIVGLLLGGSLGAWIARRAPMTAMPQIVGLFNGFGGGASALVASAEYLRFAAGTVVFTLDGQIALALSLLIGPVTLAGSLVAFGKLHGLLRDAPIDYPFQKQGNAVLLGVIVILGVLFALDPDRWPLLVAIIGLSLVLGVTSVIMIGGGDMPVVISLLNAFSGLAAAATGFALGNDMLIVSGALVGAAGLILTHIMCKAMNRSLVNVLFAEVGAEHAGAAPGAEQRTVVRYTPQDIQVMLDTAQNVIIVPGYGLAVAQAQHVLQELVEHLIRQGINARYAIHPVAGRMPGHMNVLLAEANAPYELLLDLEEINDDFQMADVVLVVGANDVVNPAARYKKDSPLYGMPILNADYARAVIVLKRSLKPGFAGEDNELFYDTKTMMVFGDAKDTLLELARLVKAQ
jgi:H+-translocating NAD(P) transhydrogenase subunit beta